MTTTSTTSSPPRVAIITGASAGLGRALATRLVKDGWVVIGTARHSEVLEELETELGSAFVVVAGDVADARHRAELIATVERHGRLDLLVNNASTLGSSPLPAVAELTTEVLERVLAVNVVGPQALIAGLLPLLRASSGTIVNVSSDAAVEPYETWGAYGSSKAALDHLSAVLAAEEPGIRVYAVDPGDMRTAMHQAAFPADDISDRPSPETSVPGFIELVAGDRPSGRYRARDLDDTRAPDTETEEVAAP